jgi:hypothetical protein
MRADASDAKRKYQDENESRDYEPPLLDRLQHHEQLGLHDEDWRGT